MFSVKRLFVLIFVVMIVIINCIGIGNVHADDSYFYFYSSNGVLKCRITISPSPLDFGNVIVNTTQSKNFHISCETFNTPNGYYICELQPSICETPPFTYNFIEDDFGSKDILINFTPTSLGSFSNTINFTCDICYINSNTGLSSGVSFVAFLKIQVSGNGVPPPHPFTLESFENGFGNWTVGTGTPTSVTTYKHSGNNSFSVNEDQEYIYNTQGSNLNKVATVYFYDNKDTNMKVFASVDNGTTDIGMGVDLYNNSYSYKIGGTYTSSPVPRSTGWH